jgi:hypothetical protein
MLALHYVFVFIHKFIHTCKVSNEIKSHRAMKTHMHIHDYDTYQRRIRSEVAPSVWKPCGTVGEIHRSQLGGIVFAVVDVIFRKGACM